MDQRQIDHEHDCLVMDACINATDWLDPADARRAKAFIGLSEEDVEQAEFEASCEDPLDIAMREAGALPGEAS